MLSVIKAGIQIMSDAVQRRTHIKGAVVDELAIKVGDMIVSIPLRLATANAHSTPVWACVIHLLMVLSAGPGVVERPNLGIGGRHASLLVRYSLEPRNNGVEDGHKRTDVPPAGGHKDHIVICKAVGRRARSAPRLISLSADFVVVSMIDSEMIHRQKE